MTIRFQIFLMMFPLRLLIIKNLFLRKAPQHAAGTVRLLLLFSKLISCVVARSFATIGDIESSIHAQNDVQIYDDDLHGEVEDIEAPLVLVPSRMVEWSRVLELRTASEGSSEA